MKVFVQSVNFNADKDLVEFVNKKVEGLEKFHDKIVDAEVFLKVQQTSEKENKIIELKLNIARVAKVLNLETAILKQMLLQQTTTMISKRQVVT